MSRRKESEAPPQQAGTAPATKAPAHGKREVIGICVLLAVMVWIVFGQTLGAGFVNYDDNVYVYGNPEISNGITLKGIGWALTYGEIGHWHPVTWFSHMLDCEVYGLKPWGHHLTNVLLHAAAAVLLFLVLLRMTGALWRCAFVAAVFAVHPLHVESVAWVAERKDVLSGVFFMLTLGAYARYARGPLSPARFIPVAVLFAIGLMCKGMLVTLPFVLLLLDYWPLRRLEVLAQDGKPVPLREMRGPALRLVAEKIPLFALSFLSCVMTGLVPEKVPLIDKLPLSLRIGNALVSCVIYLRQMVWPAGLAIPYPYPANGWPAAEVAPALALLAVMSIMAVVVRRRRPYFMVGWFWYLGMLVPVMGIVQISYYSHADRYTYLPQIGLYLLLTWLVADLSARLPFRRFVLGGLSAILLAALMICAHIQTAYWNSNETLWNRALTVTTGNKIAHNNLGSDLLKQGRANEAIVQFQKALEINPDYAEAHNNLGNAFLQKWEADKDNALYKKEAIAQFNEAVAQFKKALELAPDYAEAQNNLGYIYQRNGQVDDAIALYQKALRNDPDMVETRLNLGIAFGQKGELNEALEEFEKAVEIDPGSAKAQNDLGLALLQSGKVEESIGHFQQALKIDPGYAGARYNLGLALQQRGNE